jgi:hypothetical protein
MSQFITGESPKRSAKEYKAAVKEMLAEIQRNNEKMAQDKVIIDRLSARTDANLARIFATLEEIRYVERPR